MPAERRCPLCSFQGTDAQVDEHRATGVHDDESQAGSNVRSSRLPRQRQPGGYRD